MASSSVNITSEKQKLSELKSVVLHLKEKSFKSIITWKRTKCMVNDLEIFEAIVLSTLTPAYSLSEFHIFLKEQGLTVCMKTRLFSVEFPKSLFLKKIKEKSEKSFIKNMDFMEENQDLIYNTIKRVQLKLERAIKINKQIKLELAKSETKTLNMVEKITCKPNEESFQLIEMLTDS
ncbi:hypothetical protein SteCoe_18280 [Stentor coeruleus]|uniref:Uncharacterized protein n=1 Tax=Stentor coeruleus TaxID=5963 RepID=A0A1R2BXH1_9CILI|nr:hypothetical protein SteCoe_18280 [Stentor coeruleus]